MSNKSLETLKQDLEKKKKFNFKGAMMQAAANCSVKCSGSFQSSRIQKASQMPWKVLHLFSSFLGLFSSM